MNLWFSCSLLLVGLSLSNAAVTPQECKALVTPHTTFTPMYGRWTFILGYGDNAVFNGFYTSTKSQWIDFLRTSDPNVMEEDTGLSHGPGHCKRYSTKINIMGNAGISQRSGFTCHFHSLPTCRNCLLYHVTAINNNNLIAPKGTPTTKDELKGYKAFYLMSTASSITDAELAHAKKQAECLGFTGEPTFHFNPSNAQTCDKATVPS